MGYGDGEKEVPGEPELLGDVHSLSFVSTPLISLYEEKSF